MVVLMAVYYVLLALTVPTQLYLKVFTATTPFGLSIVTTYLPLTETNVR